MLIAYGFFIVCFPLICLVFTIQVNASDNRGKADAKIFKGISGSNANCIKELISNEALGFEMDRLINYYCLLNIVKNAVKLLPIDRSSIAGQSI